MRNSYLQSLIKKFKKKKGKLIYSHELKKIIKVLMKSSYADSKAYKLIHYLKNKEYLLSIKKNIFYIKSPDQIINEDEVGEKWYRSILYHHCKSTLGTKRYIGGLKALELHYNNLEVPNTILIINEKKQSKEMALSTKTIQFKKYTAKGKNFFLKFKKNTEKIKIDKHQFSIANKELSLLECLYNHDKMFDREIDIMVKKVIKKSKTLDIKNIIQLIKLGKHHSSINRLYLIAKKTNKTLSIELATVIKRYSFFLDL